jgi:hypothetical protein
LDVLEFKEDLEAFFSSLINHKGKNENNLVINARGILLILILKNQLLLVLKSFISKLFIKPINPMLNANYWSFGKKKISKKIYYIHSFMKENILIQENGLLF